MEHWLTPNSTYNHLGVVCWLVNTAFPIAVCLDAPALVSMPMLPLALLYAWHECCQLAFVLVNWQVSGPHECCFLLVCVVLALHSFTHGAAPPPSSLNSAPRVALAAAVVLLFPPGSQPERPCGAVAAVCVWPHLSLNITR